MPTIHQPQPMDDAEVRAMVQEFWRARYRAMPSDLAALTYPSYGIAPQPVAIAMLASPLAPPSTWLRETLAVSLVTKRHE